MKNYDDFLASLTEDVIVDIADKVNEKKIPLINANSKNILSSTMEGITALSLTCSIELLRLYHEWLHD